jgi:choline dehydrogenase-like flavoprotein
MSSARTDGGEIHADVCIIGAGPAGITIARELGHRGARVCVLEAGGQDPERRHQRQSRGESDGYPLTRLDNSRVRAFGGTLRHPRIWDAGWAARPLDPIDFEERPGRPEFGWPINHLDLAPYYVNATRLCGIAPFDEAFELWRERLSSEGCSLETPDLESTVFQFPTAAFHDAWHALSGCSNVRLLLETRAVEIRIDSTGQHVDRIVAVRGHTERITVRPRLVVLATGGIENARLLLTADEGRGLGNEHDLVGRYFAERLSFHAGHVVLADGVSVDQLDMFQRADGAECAGALRVAERLQRERDLLNFVFFLVPRPAAVASDAIRSLTTLGKAIERRPAIDRIGWHSRNIATGIRHLSDLGLSRVTTRPRVLALRVQGEQAPNRESRVTLGSRTDDLGIPVARVTWRIREEDLRSVEKSATVLDAVMRAQGIGSVEWTARPDSRTLVVGNHHHLGTTRMHADPRQGVVDADSRVHSIDNLFVGGSSVFPTYGASNPTLTIVALALRLADKLNDVLHQSGLRGDEHSRS